MSGTQAGLTAFGTEQDSDSIQSEIERLLNIRAVGDEVTEELLNGIERTEAVDEVLATVDFNELVEDISAHGKRLRKSKPDSDGLTQYVWRHARFNCSRNDSIPVMADCWLKQYIREHTAVELGSGGLRSDEGTEIKNALERVEIAAALELGADPTRMARAHADLF